ncbi:MAG: cupredoxin domain-containing protein [Anaerolineales bacterium]|nr:cupredoxin domain-containing protein [Anaerolineales bacterium]
MNVKLHNRLFGVGLLLLLALTACSGANGGGSGAMDITVETLDTFRFSPATLTADVGQTLNVTLNNTGVLEHNFVIDEFNVSLGPVPAGQTSSGSFTPNAAGSYTYYCNVPGHREAGMEGTLTVNP